MSGPTVERTRPSRVPSGQRRAIVPGPRTESAAVGRAYARRASRNRRLADDQRAGPPGRTRFVLVVMLLLAAGLVASLWLSTTAAADSYRLDEAAHATRDLSERSESLRTEIAGMRSALALAQAARDMGMVPMSDVARLVAMPDGSVRLVGTPKAAFAAPAPVAAPPPDAPASLPVAAPPPDAPAQLSPVAAPASPDAPLAQGTPGEAPPAQSPALPEQLAAGAG
ncbi:MAG: hypothetical protein JO100_03270 [Pseudonocardia sp.]|nr:hypothetical protein [Pseudonocardia sp.]